jgi:hypothetical protein
VLNVIPESLHVLRVLSPQSRDKYFSYLSYENPCLFLYYLGVIIDVHMSDKPIEVESKYVNLSGRIVSSTIRNFFGTPIRRSVMRKADCDKLSKCYWVEFTRLRPAT